MKYYNDIPYEQVSYGSGIFRDLRTGKLIQGSRKSLRRNAGSLIRRNETDFNDTKTDVMNKIEKNMDRPAPLGNQPLSKALTNGVKYLKDAEGKVRPNAHELLKTDIIKKIPKDTFRPPKDRKKDTPPLSQLLNKKSSKRGKGLRVHGTGLSLHGSGIAYI